MKNEIRLALLCMAATAAPAFAQNAIPHCGSTNLDYARNVYTVIKPVAGAVNQQCLLTVYPSAAMPDESRQQPGSYVVEGTYAIELSGGGGGGGGGASKDQGGGGGGAGAAPSRTVQYLAPGEYKMTLGTGGDGGSANGGRTESGNPTSLTRVNTGQLVAGFEGADTWRQRSQTAQDGRGGVAAAGGSSGGDGGNSGAKTEQMAQSGGVSQSGGYAAMPGQAGSETGRSAQTDAGSVVQSNAGGGGGASMGSGGAGESASIGSVAGVGDLGGGGGGGRGGLTTADAGGNGGHGYIRLTMTAPAQRAIAPAPVVLAPVSTTQKFSLSADMLFGFGKSTLRPEGKAKLDEVVGKLAAVNVDSITDTGHADRIGSSKLNQKMSVDRAEAVKTYLVSKGVHAGSISVVGKGATEPVTTADACKGAATAKVIACLQPDRRVEIEVVGTNKMVSMN
jgi:outer membrane protein OmpA-like peptidoglycan-associated protein